ADRRSQIADELADVQNAWHLGPRQPLADQQWPTPADRPAQEATVPRRLGRQRHVATPRYRDDVGLTRSSRSGPYGARRSRLAQSQSCRVAFARLLRVLRPALHTARAPLAPAASQASQAQPAQSSLSP